RLDCRLPAGTDRQSHHLPARRTSFRPFAGHGVGPAVTTNESIAGLPAGSIRLAIVDDSPFVRKAIERIVGGERAIRVVGAAGSGEELLARLGEWAPDIVTLDLSMPGVGGLHTLDVLAARKIPVIVFSSYLGLDPSLSIEAAYRGTVEFIDKNEYSLIDFGALRAVLIEKICSLSGGPPVCVAA